MRGKVILFYPPYDGPPLSAPLCSLTSLACIAASGRFRSGRNRCCNRCALSQSGAA